MPSEVTLVPALLAELVPLGVEATLDELPLEGERSRDIAAGLAAESLSVSTVASVTVDSALYFFHIASTWRRERAGRFSRLAASDSKQ